MYIIKKSFGGDHIVNVNIKNLDKLLRDSARYRNVHEINFKAGNNILIDSVMRNGVLDLEFSDNTIIDHDLSSLKQSDNIHQIKFSDNIPLFDPTNNTNLLLLGTSPLITADSVPIYFATESTSNKVELKLGETDIFPLILPDNTSAPDFNLNDVLVWDGNNRTLTINYDYGQNYFFRGETRDTNKIIPNVAEYINKAQSGLLDDVDIISKSNVFDILKEEQNGKIKFNLDPVWSNLVDGTTIGYREDYDKIGVNVSTKGPNALEVYEDGLYVPSSSGGGDAYVADIIDASVYAVKQVFGVDI
jgi:hypothetical protein